jgi:hypothetical protein
MEQQAPQARSGGTNDVMIMIVLFVVVTIGILVGFYMGLYKPKTEDIKSMRAQRDSKKNQLNTYITEVKDLYNYKDRLNILNDKWAENKHYYILGGGKYEEEKKYTPQQYQFAIFDAYDKVFDFGAAAGVEILFLKVSESFKYYMHDDVWDLPYNLLQFDWDIVFSSRPVPEGAEEASTSLATAMVTAHTFSATLRGDYEGIRRFIEIVQNMEGDYQKIYSIHCFGVSEEPSYYVYPISFGGRGGGVLTDVTVEVEMLMTFYELNEYGTPGAVPDVPGTVSCSFSGGGGGGGGGSSPGGGGGGGGTMSMG